ncbi:MAG TPA: TolC family protein [Kofleriaceae bacterium]|nr:TolC family protein [Kofleriaceae bacterium]
MPARPIRRSLVRAHLLLAVVGLPGAARAQPAGAVPEVDQPTFLARFTRSDARLEAVRARARAADGDLLEAGALANPEVSYQREEVFAGGQGAADQLGLLSWRLEIPGARGRRIAAARAARDAARLEAGDDARGLQLAALAVLHDAAHARLRLELLAAVRVELAALVEIVRARSRKGDVSGADLDRALLELGAHDDLVSEAALDLEQARAELARLAGARGGALDAARSVLDPPAPPGRVADLVAAARRLRADLRAERARSRAAGRRASAAGRRALPELSLTGGIKTSDLGDRTATGYVAGVGLSIPIFDRGQGARVRAEAEQRAHAAWARAIESALVSEVRAAHRALVAAIERARVHAEERVPRALALRKSAEAAYREGERPLFELLDAHRMARDVRLRALELRRAARRAELTLVRATGGTP